MQFLCKQGDFHKMAPVDCALMLTEMQHYYAFDS